VQFTEFFALLVPSLVNWLVPATLIGFFMPGGKPSCAVEGNRLRPGGLVIVAMFLATIACTVLLNHLLGLPAFLGMMLGLGALNVYGYFLNSFERRNLGGSLGGTMTQVDFDGEERGRRPVKPFDSFDALRELEWDTLLFFYGILLCVGGLGAMGYLALLSNALYGGVGATAANVAIGVLSAAVDNIPLTFAVLSMGPAMDHGQWLLLTLTAGTGGSLLSIGSAAGVALMGIAQGGYTFSSHMRWAWAVALGYVGGIAAHLAVNATYFTGAG
jgi:Na+/H+ antiporter NhaD/arsenite permease-like protein